MRGYSTGELFFRLICLVVLSSVESFNWTAQPTNPTPAIKGQDVSLAWEYLLTADELLQSQTQYFLFWKKLNQATLTYDQIGTKTYLQLVGAPSYQEPRSPHIEIDRNDSATLHIKDVRREDEGTYKIEFILESDGTVVAEQRVNLTVLELPEFDYASDNQDVCEDSMVTLYCNATGKPVPNITWTRVWENGTDSEQLSVVDGSYVINNIKRSSNGTYRCTAYNGVGDPVNQTLEVTVRYSASVVRVIKSSDKVIEGDTLSLTCEASGDPMPNVTWITVSDDEHSYGNKLNFTNITRGDSGDYRCETKNRCGEESRNESIDVFYPPTDTMLGHTINVFEGAPASIPCPVHGNPVPNITWYKGNDTSSNTAINTSSTLRFAETTLGDSGWYTCFAKNYLGNDTVRVYLRVAKPVPSTPSTSSKPTTKVEESTISARATIDTSCNKRLDVEKQFPNMACERVKHLGCLSAQALDSRCGSVIIDFEMKFNQSAVVSVVLAVLKTAAKEDNFNGFKVNPNSIEQISSPTSTSSTKKPVCSGFFKKEDCSINLVPIIVIAVVGLVVICIIVGVIACWVHKRRKCRKDTRVHHSTSEEQPFSRANSTPGDDNSNSQVNNGYAEAGPLPSKMTDTAQHQGASSPAAVPTYAVVDKSAKKGKKKDKKVEEQKPQAEPPQYSVVDKSKKKKKKEEPEATYAQVDMSKKSKKKPKAGEVLYADLGDFHQMQELPNVSTSPKALPPIKKPEAYVETQYADITQFLKGDVTLPDSSNSQEPAGGTQAAAVPENQESQESGTSAKETSQASNPGGDGGPGHETNF